MSGNDLNRRPDAWVSSPPIPLAVRPARKQAEDRRDARCLRGTTGWFRRRHIDAARRRYDHDRLLTSGTGRNGLHGLILSQQRIGDSGMAGRLKFKLVDGFVSGWIAGSQKQEAGEEKELAHISNLLGLGKHRHPRIGWGGHLALRHPYVVVGIHVQFGIENLPPVIIEDHFDNVAVSISEERGSIVRQCSPKPIHGEASLPMLSRARSRSRRTDKNASLDRQFYPIGA